MTNGDRAALVGQLHRHEGIRLRPYTDSVGKLTIGCGRNLTDNGITLVESDLLLSNDIEECILDLVNFGWFVHMAPIRQRAVVDLRFNLGPAKFRRFVKMLDALERYDFPTAADEALASVWAEQIQPSRRDRVVSMLRTGVDA